MNYFDILLAKKLEDDRDPKVEGLSVTENGRYHEDGVVYDPVIVEVPEPTLISKSITANGTYTASDDNADGYSSVSVNVPLPQNAYLLKSIEHEQVATFNDGTDNFLKSLEVAIEPQQDLHGYDAPWVGGSGKNKLAPFTGSTKEGTTLNVNSDGTAYFSGSDSSARSFDFGRQLKAGTYILSGAPNGSSQGNYDMFVSYGGSVIARSYSGSNLTQFTLESDSTVTVGIRGTSGTLDASKKFYPMIRLASVADATFAPYSNECPISGWDEVNVTVADDLENPTTSNVYTIDLDGTRYGGKLDVVNGVLTVDRAIVDLGTLNWQTQGNPNTFQAVISDMLTPSNNIMCSHYPTTPASTSAGNMSDKSIKTYGNSSAKYIIVKDSSYTDVATIQTAMNGVQLVYELATPLTIQLSPTIIKSLQGNNNFFASTGEIEWMQYWGKEQN